MPTLVSGSSRAIWLRLMTWPHAPVRDTFPTR